MPPVSVELKKQIKTANDIVDVVQSYIPVHPMGKIFKSICPFHNDTRPSLQIDRNYQNYHCWSCGARGDVFDFVVKFEKVGFGEALRILAERAGIALDASAQNPEDYIRGRLLDAVLWAEQQYRECLLEDPSAESARKYLGTRHIAGPMVRQFGLGYAPVAGDWLVRRAADQKVPPDVLVEVGLIAASKDEGRGFYDRFRDRIMFPIRDMRGRTVGFGGRVLPDSPLAARGPKYYNSGDTPLFSKSDLLYGLDLARHAGSTSGYLAVVEGYTDVMMAHQCGIANVVATMGTALNTRHVSQLRRYTNKVVLVFDADQGGITGVDRALELFVSQEAELTVATLPDGLDPCDLLLRPDGPETFRKALENSVDALEFKLNSLLSRESTASIDGSKRIVDAILGVMALAPEVPSQAGQVRRELIVSRLSHRLGLRQETVWARFVELKADRKRRERRDLPNSAPTPEIPKSGPAPVQEVWLLQALLAEPELVADAKEKIKESEISHTGLRRMISELYSLCEAGELPDFDALRSRLFDRPDLVSQAMELQSIGRKMTNRKSIFAEFDRIRTAAEMKSLKDRLGAVPDEEKVILLRKLDDLGKAAAG